MSPCLKGEMKLSLVFGLMFALSVLGAPAPSQWGSFPDRPLELRDLVPPDGRSFSLIKDFKYVDQFAVSWLAPARLITDGATIPTPFWSVIGGPFEGLYREAAVVHDAGCCGQIKPWQNVHRMFFNGMRCSGVDWLKAKTMFFAVWLGGPRWPKLNSSMPADCLVASPVGGSRIRKVWRNLPPQEVVSKLWQTILQRNLTVPETRAVARPFFPRGPMTDADANKFVMTLKERGAKPEEQDLIALSVMQSEQISDNNVREIERWIEKENPSLETIESRAEEMRGRKTFESRLFPEVPELLRSFAASPGKPRKLLARAR